MREDELFVLSGDLNATPPGTESGRVDVDSIDVIHNSFDVVFMLIAARTHISCWDDWIPALAAFAMYPWCGLTWKNAVAADPRGEVREIEQNCDIYFNTKHRQLC